MGGQAWLELDFQAPKRLSSLEVQGSDFTANFTESLELQYSFDGITFTDYSKRLSANYDDPSVVRIDLSPSILAVKLRVAPKDWVGEGRLGSPALRLEVYGEDQECVCDTRPASEKDYYSEFPNGSTWHILKGMIAQKKSNPIEEIRLICGLQLLPDNEGILLRTDQITHVNFVHLNREAALFEAIEGANIQDLS